MKLIALLAAAAFVAPDDTTLADRNARGQQADRGAAGASLSADGRYVAFVSDATNLVRGFRESLVDVFVRDLRTGRVEIVSRATGKNGTTGDEGSDSPAISGDGRFVAFEGGRDLHPDAPRDYGPILLRDRKRHTTVLVSRASGARGATADDAAENASISHDGRFVAFQSEASNLHPGDHDHRTDVFVRDVKRNRTLLVSRANGVSENPSMSADGRYVAFESTANNLNPADTDTARDVYVKDLRTGRTLLVSRAPGLDGVKGDGRAMNPAISADGRFVAFEFWRGSNLHPDDTDRKRDVYVRDLRTGETTLVSRADGHQGVKQNGSAYDPSISADGRLVSFETTARNLDPADTDSAYDVYVRDIVAGTTRLVSRAAGAAGAKATGGERFSSEGGVLAANGRSIAFDSDATNLDPDDRDDDFDVFLRGL